MPAPICPDGNDAASADLAVSCEFGDDALHFNRIEDDRLQTGRQQIEILPGQVLDLACQSSPLPAASPSAITP